MSWKKIGKAISKAARQAAGTFYTMHGGWIAGAIKNGGDIKQGINDAMHLHAYGTDKPQQETAPDVVSGGVQAAIEEEENKRRKKKGFAANVLTDEFRFGGGPENL